eukprot:3889250-Lingulodinium_polyedra.AAC.1
MAAIAEGRCDAPVKLSVAIARLAILPAHCSNCSTASCMYTIMAVNRSSYSLSYASPLPDALSGDPVNLGM